MRSGDFEIIEVLPSIFSLDGGAMFGIVPKVIWEKVYPADDKNRIDMAGRIFIILRSDRCIIIEAGTGDKYNQKLQKTYNIRLRNLDELLSTIGIKREMVTDVILSHLHFDHAGGLTRENGGEILPVFKNARIYFQKSQLRNALSPSIKDRASYIREDFEFLLDYHNVVALEGEYKITDGIFIKPVNGHTPGMQTVYIETGERNFIFTADLIPTARHIRLPYIMAYDINPLLAIEEKSALLEYAVEHDSILLFPHDIFTAAARVERRGDDFDIKEEVAL